MRRLALPTKGSTMDDIRHRALLKAKSRAHMPVLHSDGPCSWPPTSFAYGVITGAVFVLVAIAIVIGAGVIDGV